MLGFFVRTGFLQSNLLMVTGAGAKPKPHRNPLEPASLWRDP